MVFRGWRWRIRFTLFSRILCGVVEFRYSFVVVVIELLMFVGYFVFFFIIG